MTDREQYRRFISMDAAGWHICFDVLDRLLSGTPIGRIVGDKAKEFQWESDVSLCNFIYTETLALEFVRNGI
jgi:hypothetical protein